MSAEEKPTQALPVRLDEERVLSLATSLESGRPPFVTAASGLVALNDRFYIVADDEHWLLEFTYNNVVPGKAHRIFSGDLPLANPVRKKIKPDLESLTFVRASTTYPNGALLAVPSGSKPNRGIGAIIEFQPDQSLGTVQIVDFNPAFAEFAKRVGPLNVEGAVLDGESLVLFQRGNSKGAASGVAWFVFQDLLAGRPTPLTNIQIYDLGMIDGVPLTFTDACLDTRPNKQGCLFLAVAEATDDAYLDGAFLGSVVGKVDSRGELKWTRPLLCPQKPEGLALAPWLGPESLLIVTDADDPTVASKLFKGNL